MQEYPQGVTALQVAQSISEGLARNVLSAKVNGEVIDATRPISMDSTLQLLTWTDKEGKATYWHSSAHLMAEAIEALYPGTLFGIGPAIENGFYYDIDTQGKQLSGHDLAQIESKMISLAQQKSDYIRKEIGKSDAIAYFTEKKDPYKLELLEVLKTDRLHFILKGILQICAGAPTFQIQALSKLPN